MTAATCTYFAPLFLSYSSGLDCRNRLLNFPLPPKFPSIFFFLPSHLGFHFSAVSHKMSLFQNLFTHKSHSHKTKLQLSQNQVSAPLTLKSHSHKTKSHSYHTKLPRHNPSFNSISATAALCSRHRHSLQVRPQPRSRPNLLPRHRHHHSLPSMGRVALSGLDFDPASSLTKPTFIRYNFIDCLGFMVNKNTNIFRHLLCVW